MRLYYLFNLIDNDKQRISERRILKTVKYGKIKVARFRIRWLVQVGKKEAPGYLGVAGGFEQRKVGIFFGGKQVLGSN